ncbi:MAG TPA: homoprotocatechuate degradation operon regulator HpaR [Casimicrobiaceae bacterium]|nr:homoprotocatechuate degradation operon regulator HpaR [Casimicrobiaceae bacterium]
MKPAHRNLPLLLLHAREAAMAHFRPILKRFRLTDQQWRIVRVLSEAEDGLEPGQIAEACKIQKPSLTGILTRMAQMKLVDRDRSEVDQRRQRISLTAKGRALVDRMTPFIDRQYQRIEQKIGVETLSDIYRSIDTVLALLNGVGESGNDPGRQRRRDSVGYRVEGSSPDTPPMRAARKAKRPAQGDRRLRG